MRIILLLLIGIISFFSLQAQNMKRVRQITDSLCAPYMNGRGYTNQGDKIAATFIQKEFEKAGLSFFEAGAWQEFKLDVNVFNGAVFLKVGGKELKTGEDYIVHAACPTTFEGGKLIYLDSNAIFNPDQWLLQQKFSKSVVAYPKKYEKEVFEMPKVFVKKILKAKAYLVITEKLTHFISRDQDAKPKFMVLRDAFDPKARKVEFGVEAQIKRGYPTQNVIGYIKGTAKPDSFLTFTAHYDHLGNMGNDTYFPGANDNASGVAALIELANHYAKNPPKYSVAFIAFGAEEAGLVGSRYYTALPYFSLQSIKFLINLDLFATGEEGMTAVNGSIFKEEFELLQQINQEKGYLKQIGKRGEAANSDHYFFYQAGVPCFFFYLQGDWKHYHDVDDKTPVPYTDFEDAYHLVKDFSDALMR